LNDILSKALKRAGINKKVSVHGLRHTGISYFLRHGAASEVVSKQAGHNDISTTNGIYYSVIEEQKKDMYKGLL
jgi:site-specific recombinase XerD